MSKTLGLTCGDDLNLIVAQFVDQFAKDRRHVHPPELGHQHLSNVVVGVQGDARFADVLAQRALSSQQTGRFATERQLNAT